MNEAFEALLERAAREHGHLCPGQVLGVRLALLGCRLVGVDPGEERKPLVVFVEIDRCATDAIQMRIPANPISHSGANRSVVQGFS